MNINKGPQRFTVNNAGNEIGRLIHSQTNESKFNGMGEKKCNAPVQSFYFDPF